MTSDEARAFHEAGHAVMFAIRNIPLRHCSVIRSGRTGGRVMTAVPFAQVEIGDLLLALAAGGHAESKCSGRPSEADADDRRTMVEYASILAEAPPDSEAVAKCLARYDILAAAMVSVHWQAIERVAKRLMWKGAIPPEQIQLIMKGTL